MFFLISVDAFLFISRNSLRFSVSMRFSFTSINIHTITDDASYFPYGISRLVLYAINVYVIIIAYYKARHVLKDGVVGFRSYCSARQLWKISGWSMGITIVSIGVVVGLPKVLEHLK